MNSNDKIENMKKAIIKSGFPLEIFTANILRSKKYRIIQHQYYNDDKENKFREIDLLAEKFVEIENTINNTTFIFQNILVIECKKQEENSPWLFFEGYRVNKDTSTLLFSSTKNFVNNKWVADTIFPKTHYYNKIPCIYYIPPFKLGENPKDKTKDYIHDTIFQLYSALTKTGEIFEEFQSKIMHKRIYFYYPLIVLDGDLYSSKISDIETIEIVPQNHIQLLLNFQDKPYSLKWGDTKIVKKETKMMIDIIKKEYLSDFLDSIVLHGEEYAQKQKFEKLIKKV